MMNYNWIPSHLVWAQRPAGFGHSDRAALETVGNLINIILFRSFQMIFCLQMSVLDVCSNAKTVHMVEGLPTDRATFIRSAKLGA